MEWSPDEAQKVWRLLFLGIEFRWRNLIYCAGDLHKEDGRDRQPVHPCSGIKWPPKCPGEYQKETVKKLLDWAERDVGNLVFFLETMLPGIGDIASEWEGRLPLGRIEEFLAFIILSTDNEALRRAVYQEAEKLCKTSRGFLTFFQAMINGDCDRVLMLNTDSRKRKRQRCPSTGLQRIVSNWYNTPEECVEEMFLEAATSSIGSRAGNFTMTHAQVIKLCHVKPANTAVNFVLQYLLHYSQGNEQRVQGLKLVQNVEEACEKERNGLWNPGWGLMKRLLGKMGVLLDLKRTDRYLKSEDVAGIIRKNPWLRKQHIPQFYCRNTEVVSATLRVLTLREMLDYLPSLTVYEVFKDSEENLKSRIGGMSIKQTDNPSAHQCDLDLVLQRLKSSDECDKAGLLPDEVLLYWKQYELERGKLRRANKCADKCKMPFRFKKQEEISTALCRMYHNAFKERKPANTRWLISVDVRPEVLDSFLYRCKPLVGFDAVRSILLRALILEKTVKFLAFLRNASADQSECEKTVLTKLNLHCGMNFMDLTAPLRRVDHSITVEVEKPVEWALEQKELVDCFVIITTCKRSVDLMLLTEKLEEYRSTVYSDAKLVLCLLLQGHLDTPLMSTNNVMIVEGFDKYTPELIWQFAASIL